MRRVAVIGGSGFIGHYLSKELLKRGYEVCVVDINKPEWDIHFRKADILDLASLTEALQGMDGVFHLAALVGVDNCLSSDESVINTNLKGTENVLKSCHENGINRLLFSSSSEVYGDGVRIPFSEEDDKYPKSTYGKTKILSERILKKHACATFQIRIVRFFNVYGFEQRSDFVVKRFIERIINGQSIAIYGDGMQTRCFTHVMDAVRGAVDVYEYIDSDFDVFNIANSSVCTILELAELIAKLSRNSLEIKKINFGQNGVRPKEVEIFRRIPDTKKAKKLLGFEAEISLEDGIHEFIADIRRIKS